MSQPFRKVSGSEEDHELFRRVKRDLSQRHPKTLVTGRNSTPVEVILRLLTVKHLYNWSYEDTIRFVNDSLVLRWFCRIYFHRICSDKTGYVATEMLIDLIQGKSLESGLYEMPTQLIVRGSCRAIASNTPSD